MEMKGTTQYICTPGVPRTKAAPAEPAKAGRMATVPETEAVKKAQ